MRFANRFIAVSLVVCLFVALLPISASADLTSGDFTFKLSGEQSGVIITGYNGAATTLEIPDTIFNLPVIQIASNAIGPNDTLESITLPGTLQTIEARAFEACTALTSIDIPDSVQSIGTQAFYNCYSLASINLSPNTYDIGYQAFHNTLWLVRCDNGPVYIGRVLYTYFGFMPDNTTLTIRDHTAAIASGAFEGRDELIAVYLPVGLRRIGADAFADCVALTTIRIPPSVTTVGDHILANSTLAVVHCVKDSTIDLYAKNNNLYTVYDDTLDYLDGDTDKNGSVDSTDFRLLMRAIISGKDIDHERYLSCDIIYDGSVDTQDLREWMLLSIQ